MSPASASEPASAALHGQHFDAVIIGAGMSGLAAGIRLALYKKRVLIVERHSRPGGLNSYYNIGPRRCDVGLHAVTNYAPPGAKGVPLAKIFRQLRLSSGDFALAPQLGSEIHFAGKRVRFTNDFSVFESDIACEFPAQVDAFRRLDSDIRAIPATALDAVPGSAREFVAGRIADPLLADLLFIPLSFYGSARENDMDLPQFAILWKSLFHEGFARPLEGVRPIICALVNQYRAHGGQLRLNCGVRRLHTESGRVTALELGNGAVITADNVLSSAGLPETLALSPGSSDILPVSGAPTLSSLAYCEAITALDKQPRADFGWGTTIIFFCDSDRFHYEGTTAPADTRSGVICIPNNYDYPGGTTLDEGWLRVTALAGYGAWRSLREVGAAAYAAAKNEWHARLNAVARNHLAPVPDATFKAAIREQDFFTPLTVERFTARIGGAIYGVPQKSRDGRTPWANLFICGTDQGFLGITGAMLSGISMANLHLLRG